MEKHDSKPENGGVEADTSPSLTRESVAALPAIMDDINALAAACIANQHGDSPENATFRLMARVLGDDSEMLAGVMRGL